MNFFDGITSLMQLLLLFLLGLLISPKLLLSNFWTGLSITIFMIIIARPLATTILLRRKITTNALTLLSFAGIRGAASIVFAISAINSDLTLENDIYHIVAIAVLISLIVQGSLLPTVSNKLNMILKEGNILRTLNDYVTEININFLSTNIFKENPWNKKYIKDLNLPDDIRVILVKRGEDNILPFGDLEIQEGDEIILIGKQYNANSDNVKPKKVTIDEHHSWLGKTISELSIDENKKLILINRGKEQIMPSGNLTIKENDNIIISIMPSSNNLEIPIIK